jgi:hypothetical protein
MTVMGTNTRELDINTLVWRAAQMCGLMGFEQGQDGGAQWLAKASYGRDQLELIIKQLPTEGVIVRDVIVTTTALASGTASYAMAAGTTDVVNIATYKESATGIEYQVTPMDREEWMAIPDKTTAGRPTRMYVEKLATVTVYLYPVPNVAGATLQTQRKRILADNSNGSSTADLETYWMDFLVKELCYRMSVGMPIEERALYRSDAAAAKAAAQTAAKQTVPNRIELNHPTSWR